MRFSLAIITGLAALSQGYNVDNCKAEGDTNYRICEGDYDECQKFGGQSGSICTEYSMAAPSGPIVLSGTAMAGRRAQSPSNANSLNLLVTARGKLKLKTALGAPYFEDLGA
ncbi:hypothetical protein RAB80_004051 [Fusarium oxysporum f. sp. vasinfectum]|uniref:Uncharacterized protein n=1 Tax=Fusarium oxysporum f. sp. vasinfectum 25433 TaxID=1089449 RepID=X0M7D3_FUSOX|nr:hypothetical protein FOTG_15145 [Fusarium oxysporum f. sp. vasinfectum 25433]KAK2678870.1 hypothetical protein RAB80_004051 [Fusarium oxysporum f. sp. vasinfectum]KAK2936599.1 hypothetical protein FoTM2_004545 [Fusarium oxysporum f. sp. vasinfectum]